MTRWKDKTAGQKCPAYRDRRGFPTPPKKDLPAVVPRIAGSARIIGLMSGTSHDGVDAAIVEISTENRRDKNVPPIDDRRGFLTPSKGFSDKLRIRLLHHLHLPYRRH